MGRRSTKISKEHKRRIISLKEKVAIINAIAKGQLEEKSIRTVAKELGFSPQTVHPIWRQRDLILNRVEANPDTTATVNSRFSGKHGTKVTLVYVIRH